MAKGVFITVEGIDGSGKSTFVNSLAEALREKCVITHAPGATPVGQKIRSILLSNDHKLSSYTELFLFLADRSLLVEEVIQPNLEKGMTVICDRFNDSTIAYQHGIDVSVEDLCNLASHQLQPDVTFYLDLPVDIAQKRICNKTPDRIEADGAQRQERVLNAYRALCKKHKRIITLDATQTAEELISLALNKLKEHEFI